ncbi:MAG TPA: hypothetical protein PKZ76_00935 [Xanthomonadaceae bacterium]|nr:hypothetical protein [Xanthomonadaceae bacterium]
MRKPTIAAALKAACPQVALVQHGSRYRVDLAARWRYSCNVVALALETFGMDRNGTLAVASIGRCMC